MSVYLEDSQSEAYVRLDRIDALKLVDRPDWGTSIGVVTASGQVIDLTDPVRGDTPLLVLRRQLRELVKLVEKLKHDDLDSTRFIDWDSESSNWRVMNS